MKERKKTWIGFFSSSFLSHFFLLLFSHIFFFFLLWSLLFNKNRLIFCKIMIDLWGLIDEVRGNSEGGKEREVLRSRSRSKRATGGKKGKKEIMWSRRKLRILLKTRQGARGDVMGRW